MKKKTPSQVKMNKKPMHFHLYEPKKCEKHMVNGKSISQKPCPRVAKRGA